MHFFDLVQSTIDNQTCPAHVAGKSSKRIEVTYPKSGSGATLVGLTSVRVHPHAYPLQQMVLRKHFVFLYV